MYSENLTVTLVQADIKWEDIDWNLRKFRDLILSHLSVTDLIILPEYFTTGFTMNPHTYAMAMDSKTIKWMKSIVAVKHCAIIGALLIRENSRIYNRLIFIDKDENVFFYDKRHLFKIGGEERYYSPGKNKLIVKIGQWRLFPLICYDLRFPVWSRFRNDYDVIIYVANWPDIRIDVWNTLLKARAVENQAYVIGVNRIGSDGRNISYSGNSLIFDPEGHVKAELVHNEEKIETFTISLNELNNCRRRFPVHLDADSFEIFTDRELNKS